MIYNQTISNESGIFLLPPDASATSFTASESPAVAAGIVRSQKGKPFSLLPVTAKTFLKVLGEPFHPSSKGGLAAAEPMRHLKEALAEGPAYVVRVVASDAVYPLIHFEGADDSIATTTLTFNSSPALNIASTLITLYVKDGDASTNRSVQLDTSDPDLSAEKLFRIDVFEGDGAAVESHVVSLDPTSTDEFGISNYIVTYLESRSLRLGAVINPDAAFSDIQGKFETKTTFAGGSDGGEPTTADYQKAAMVLGESNEYYSDILAMGCYDSAVLTDLGNYANKRLCMFLYDDNPALPLSGLDQTNQIGGSHGHRYYFPYWANDPFTGQSMMWGLSGAAFAARARGLKQVTGTLPGYHLSPAGADRGRIARTGIKPDGAAISDVISSGGALPSESGATLLNYRINKTSTDATGNVFIDDAITCHPKNDYLRFSHVVSIIDSISRGFYRVANELKHSPDGVTQDGLNRLMREMLDQYVAAGALVKPRNPERDGDQPYTLVIEQAEFDLWSVKWSICPTGVARRLAGQPLLVQ